MASKIPYSNPTATITEAEALCAAGAPEAQG